MALPFQKHLEWLCLEGQDLKAIQSFYDNIQMPIPTEKDVIDTLEKIEDMVIPPVARRHVKKRLFKAEHQAVWDKLGFGELHAWRCDKPVKNWSTVGKVLNHPLMRTALDVCLISRLEEDKITIMLPQVFKTELTAGAIEIYRRFFANFEAFSKTDWTDYLSRLREDQYVHTRVFAALTKPRDEVLILCGLPAEKPFSDFLKNVLSTASYKYNYYLRQNTVAADAEARRWAKIGFEAGEKFEKFGSGDANDFAKLVQTEFEYVTPDIPTLDEETAKKLLPQPPTPITAQKS